MINLSIEYLKKNLKYESDTGLWIWIFPRSKIRVGNVAGRTDSYGYIQITLDGKIYLAHRLAWFYITGEWPKDEIDHKDLNKANNKWNNLRSANNSQNGANRNKYKSNKSGYKGVCWHKASNKWIVTIRVNSKMIYVGIFIDIEDAKIAYIEAAKFHHKEYARS